MLLRDMSLKNAVNTDLDQEAERKIDKIQQQHHRNSTMINSNSKLQLSVSDRAKLDDSAPVKSH